MFDVQSKPTYNLSFPHQISSVLINDLLVFMPNFLIWIDAQYFYTEL